MEFSASARHVNRPLRADDAGAVDVVSLERAAFAECQAYFDVQDSM